MSTIYINSSCFISVGGESHRTPCTNTQPGSQKMHSLRNSASKKMFFLTGSQFESVGCGWISAVNMLLWSYLYLSAMPCCDAFWLMRCVFVPVRVSPLFKPSSSNLSLPKSILQSANRRCFFGHCESSTAKLEVTPENFRLTLILVSTFFDEPSLHTFCSSAWLLKYEYRFRHY